jgi:hypothetical protein
MKGEPPKGHSGEMRKLTSDKKKKTYVHRPVVHHAEREGARAV